MLGGHMVWVGMSRGRFVGGRNVNEPQQQAREQARGTLPRTSSTHFTSIYL